MKLTLTFLLFAVVIGVSTSLSCDRCRRKRCLHLESSLRCAGNLVRDACGCCYECAKQLNDSCGGFLNYGGTCDVGLMCNYSSLVTFHPGVCIAKVMCHVHAGANYGQWIDVGRNFTLGDCNTDHDQAVETCVCQEDGTVDCKKSRKC